MGVAASKLRLVESVTELAPGVCTLAGGASGSLPQWHWQGGRVHPRASKGASVPVLCPRLRSELRRPLSAAQLGSHAGFVGRRGIPKCSRSILKNTPGPAEERRALGTPNTN